MNTFLLKNKQTGFTIIEMMVAVVILVIATGAPLLMTTNAVRLATEAKTKVTADYLAIEALEYIKNKRDNNKLNNKQFDQELYPDGIEVQYKVDVFADAIVNCSGVSCNGDEHRMSYNIIDGIRHYGHAGVQSKFKRMVMYEYVNADELGVIVEVTWDSPTGGGLASVRMNLFSWN